MFMKILRLAKSSVICATFPRWVFPDQWSVFKLQKTQANYGIVSFQILFLFFTYFDDETRGMNKIVFWDNSAQTFWFNKSKNKYWNLFMSWTKKITLNTNENWAFSEIFIRFFQETSTEQTRISLLNLVNCWKVFRITQK